jgi:hypothetical protein
MNFVDTQVNMFITALGLKTTEKPIDLEKLNYGQFDKIKEYKFNTLEEGINLMKNDQDCQGLPECMLEAFVKNNLKT